MNLCTELREQLEAVLDGTLSAQLAGHLAGCPACSHIVAQARAARENSRSMASARAPSALTDRLKRLPRLPQACEHVQILVAAALDGELPDSDRTLLLQHLHGCPGCLASWEAFATLREAGAHAHLQPLRRAALAIAPWRRLDARRRRPLFDLRLATAAAYLVAAVTVVAISNPATVARASNAGFERAAVYAGAAVENRWQSYSRQLAEAAANARGWAGDQALKTWQSLRRPFVKRAQEPNTPARR
jgi:anti-sigma factor RsiW